MRFKQVIEKERLERVVCALQGTYDQCDGAATVAAKLSLCGTGWQGRYTCRSPACPSCRKRHIGREQSRMRDLLEGAQNEQLALLTVVIDATSDIQRLTEIVRRGRQALRNRIKACRRSSRRWDDVAIMGWVEIDAVLPDDLPGLAYERRTLLEKLAFTSFDQIEPIWIGTFHAIVFLGDVDVSEFRLAMEDQWPLKHQAHVRDFDHSRAVADNINTVVGYAMKFACATDIPANVPGGKLSLGWPPCIEAELCRWLHANQRNAFEKLRFYAGQKVDRSIDELSEEQLLDCHEPMITSVSSSIDLPLFPCINNTNGGTTYGELFDPNFHIPGGLSYYGQAKFCLSG